MAEVNSRPKIGEGALAASWRQGLKEVAQVLPAFPDSVRPVEEPGMFGNPTQQVVTKQMGKDGAQEASSPREKGGYEAMLQGYAAQAPAVEPPDRGMDR